MNPVSKKFSFSRPTLILGAALLIVGLAVALAGFHPSQFGHTGTDEVSFGTILINASCAGKFCSAVCPQPNYRVVGGGCSVQSPRGNQFNLMGASGDMTAWNCFDSNWVPGYSNVEVSAICLRVGNGPAFPYEFCGNYTIEPSAPPGNFNEVCDMNNTTPYNCSDFTYNSGGNTYPFCDGFLSCNSACSNYVVNNCQYCNTSNCDPGQIFCQDGTCQPDCANHGGGTGNGVSVGSGANCSLPGTGGSGICPGASGPGGQSGGGYCGDLLVQYPEQCDGDGHSQCDQTHTSVSCPAGTHLGPIHWDCAASCTCEDNTQCLQDVCPAGQTECSTSAECPDQYTCSAGCCVPVFGGGGAQPV